MSGQLCRFLCPSVQRLATAAKFLTSSIDQKLSSWAHRSMTHAFALSTGQRVSKSALSLLICGSKPLTYCSFMAVKVRCGSVLSAAIGVFTKQFICRVSEVHPVCTGARQRKQKLTSCHADEEKVLFFDTSCGMLACLNWRSQIERLETFQIFPNSVVVSLLTYN